MALSQDPVAPGPFGWVLQLGPDSGGSYRRVWPGPGTLSFDGHDWLPVSGEAGDIVLDGTPPSVTVTMAVPSAEARAGWLGWEGSVPARFHHVQRTAGGWERLGPLLVGHVSQPAVYFDPAEGEQVAVTVDTRPRTAPPARVWSHEAQQARAPGDPCFEQLRTTAVTKGNWPG